MLLNDILMVVTINSIEYLNLAILISLCTIFLLFACVTLKIHLNHRKYSHIPGPPNKG